MIYILTIHTEISGKDVYRCKTMKEVKEIVFDCFTDWNINKDSIEDIDSRLREACEGSIVVETAIITG